MSVPVIKQRSAAVPQALAALRRPGGVVGLFTDTTYGLVARAADEAAVRRIYEMKGRSTSKPLVCLLGAQDWVSRYCRPVDGVWLRLARACWPGPLNLILPASGQMPTHPLAGGDSVAVRVPDGDFLLELLGELDEPLVAPSANPEGAPAAQRAGEVRDYFPVGPDLIVDGGVSWSVRGSSLVDLTLSPPRLLREGGLSRACLERLLNGALR